MIFIPLFSWCFLFVAVVNSYRLDILVCYYYCYCCVMQESLFGIYQGVELLSHQVCKCSTFGNNAKQIFKVVVPICTPTAPVLEILS